MVYSMWYRVYGIWYIVWYIVDGKYEDPTKAQDKQDLRNHGLQDPCLYEVSWALAFVVQLSRLPGISGQS